MSQIMEDVCVLAPRSPASELLRIRMSASHFAFWRVCTERETVLLARLPTLTDFPQSARHV